MFQNTQAILIIMWLNTEKYDFEEKNSDRWVCNICLTMFLFLQAGGLIVGAVASWAGFLPCP